MKRRSLMLTGSRELRWVEEELPPVQGNEVLVETTAGAISIGSELQQYLGTARSSRPAGYPQMTGYESVGVVRVCGPETKQLRPGDRVVATYGHRSAAILSEDRAIRVPAGVSDELAILAILTCDVAKGIRKLRPRYEESALVTGAGTIGLLAVWMLSALGLHNIDVVEPSHERRKLALRLGARHVWAPDQIASAATGYTLAFECSSRNAAFSLLQANLCHNGRICILADGNIEPLALTPAFHEKELTIVGSSDGWDYQQHAAWYFQQVRDNSHGLEQLFQQHIPAARLAETFTEIAAGSNPPIKVLVRYAEA